jgi:hypothetical protein
MSERDEKIRQAASALAKVLTEGGKNYTVYAHTMDVTNIESEGRQFAYSVEVEEVASPRRIAP